MVMAVILLVAIAILLAFYCNFHVGKGATAYLKPLLTRYLSRNGRLAAVDTSLFRPEDDFYHAMEIPRTRGVWDIPGPLPIPFLGTKWVFFVFFRKYKMSLMHEMYAGECGNDFEMINTFIFTLFFCSLFVPLLMFAYAMQIGIANTVKSL